MESGDRVRVSYEATYKERVDGIHWVIAEDGPNNKWTNIIPRDGTVVPVNPPVDRTHEGAMKWWDQFNGSEKAAPLSGATVEVARIAKRLDGVARKMYEGAVPDLPWAWVERGSDVHILWLDKAEAHIAAGYDEPQLLADATVLQSGDQVILCLDSDWEPEERRALDGLTEQLKARFPNIRFSLITGVTGVLIDRGDHDSIRKANDT